MIGKAVRFGLPGSALTTVRANQSEYGPPS